MERPVSIFVRQRFGLLARVPTDHERDQLYPEEDGSGKGTPSIGDTFQKEYRQQSDWIPGLRRKGQKEMVGRGEGRE